MIVEMLPDHLPRVCEIDAQARPDDLLPQLGLKFLDTLYSGLLAHEDNFGVVWLQESIPMGFTLGTVNTDRLFRTALQTNALPLAWHTLHSLCRKPHLLPKVLETFLYPRRVTRADVKAELIVVAVDGATRSRGVGGQLVEGLKEGFRRRGVHTCKVTVYKKNERANQFYLKTGAKFGGSFVLFGETWNTYLYEF